MTTQPLNRSSMTNAGEGWWALAPWVSRLLLVLPTLLLIGISVRFITNPTRAFAPTGMAISSPEALTDVRAFGGITLTLVAIFTWSLFSRRRLRMAHAAVIVLMALVLAVRMFGFAQDGTRLQTGTQRVKTSGEILFLTLNAVGFALQTYGMKRTGVGR